MIDIKNITCNYCKKSYSTLSSLRLHCQTNKQHAINVEKSNIPQDINSIRKPKINIVAEKNRKKRDKNIIYKDDFCEVPLNNGTFVIFDIFVWELIKQYTITYSTVLKYPHIHVNDKLYRLHRFIYYDIFHRPKRLGYHIDHNNRNLLDVRSKNLREVLPSINNRNRTKLKNTTSIYKGVSYQKPGTWVCQLKISADKKLYYQYKNELHAAYHYDILVIENNLEYCTIINNVEKPENFILNKKYIKQNNLPVGVEKHRRKYRYKFHGKYSRVFNTIEEALSKRNEKIENEKIELENNLLNEPILRNKEGIPIIEIFYKKEKIEIMVDAHRYYELKRYNICYGHGYARIIVNGEKYILSRYLLNCTNKARYVDHIDNNTLNYQMNNLRIVTKLQNAQNKSSVGKGSKYVGVSYATKAGKWLVSINKNQYKNFNTEQEAVSFRDIKAHELNLLGNMFKINLQDELQANLFINTLSEDNFNMNNLFY